MPEKPQGFYSRMKAETTGKDSPPKHPTIRQEIREEKRTEQNRREEKRREEKRRGETYLVVIAVSHAREN